MCPDIALGDVLEDFGLIVLPPAISRLAGGQSAIEVLNATFTILIARLHG
jgi:hypothetical protein